MQGNWGRWSLRGGRVGEVRLPISQSCHTVSGRRLCVRDRKLRDTEFARVIVICSRKHVLETRDAVPNASYYRDRLRIIALIAGLPVSFR